MDPFWGSPGMSDNSRVRALSRGSGISPATIPGLPGHRSLPSMDWGPGSGYMWPSSVAVAALVQGAVCQSQPWGGLGAPCAAAMTSSTLVYRRL